MENQATIKTKKQLFFGNSFLVFIYNNLIVALYVLIPSMIGAFTVVLLKSSNEILNGGAAATSALLLTSPIVNIFYILLGILLAFLTVIAIFQDIVKNYQVDKGNYKKVLGYFTVFFIARSLVKFSIISLVINIFAVGMLYWLLNEKLLKGKEILEKKFLTGKNIIIIAVLTFILSALSLYISDPNIKTANQINSGEVDKIQGIYTTINQQQPKINNFDEFKRGFMLGEPIGRQTNLHSLTLEKEVMTDLQNPAQYQSFVVGYMTGFGFGCADTHTSASGPTDCKNFILSQITQQIRR